MSLIKSKSNLGNLSAFEQRLHFHILQDTTQWRQLKKRFESRRIERHLKNAVLVCISKLNRSNLPHFKYDPYNCEDHQYPVLLINSDSTISSIMHLIRQETGISPKTGLSITQEGKLLVPSTKLVDLKLELGEIVFLNYTQSEGFG